MSGRGARTGARGEAGDARGRRSGAGAGGAHTRNGSFGSEVSVILNETFDMTAGGVRRALEHCDGDASRGVSELTFPSAAPSTQIAGT